METDLLDGKYGTLSIQVIADWLGHSPKVMLKHYRRVREDSFQQVIQCKTSPQTDEKLAVYLTVQSRAEGGKSGYEAETASPPLSTQSLDNTALSGKEGQQEESSPNCPDCPNGEDRIGTIFRGCLESRRGMSGTCFWRRDGFHRIDASFVAQRCP